MLYYYEVYYSGAWTQQQQRDYYYILYSIYMCRNGVSLLQKKGFLPSGFFACLCFFLPLSLFSQKPKCPFILTIAMTDKNAIFICEGAQVCDKLPVASGDPLKALFISAAALMASQGSRLK